MIPVTKFMPPRGETRDGGFERPEGIEKMAKEVLDTGGRFTIEALRTGEVSLAYEKKWAGEEMDVDIDIIPNGPEVLEAIDKMVKRLHEKFVVNAKQTMQEEMLEIERIAQENEEDENQEFPTCDFCGCTSDHVDPCPKCGANMCLRCGGEICPECAREYGWEEEK